MKKSVSKYMHTDFFNYLIPIKFLCLEALQIFCLEVLDIC